MNNIEQLAEITGNGRAFVTLPEDNIQRLLLKPSGRRPFTQWPICGQFLF